MAESLSVLGRISDYVYPPLSGFIDRFMIALIVIFVGFIIGRVLGRLVKRALHELEVNFIFRKATGVKASVEEITGHFVEYFIYFMTLVMALNHLGLSTTVLHIIAGAVILIVIVSLILAIKDFIPNLFAGFFIYQKRFIKTGDVIRTDSVEGKVKRVTLIETVIETKHGDTIYIPNSNLTKNPVIKVRKKK